MHSADYSNLLQFILDFWRGDRGKMSVQLISAQTVTPSLRIQIPDIR